MDKKEIIKQLHEAFNWIVEVSNQSTDNNGSDEPHIKDMLEGIENAINNLSMDAIEVEPMYIYTDEELSVRGYDIEGMRIEFERKLDCIIKNAGL
jgi:hypothetical protein